MIAYNSMNTLHPVHVTALQMAQCLLQLFACTVVIGTVVKVKVIGMNKATWE